MVNDNKFLERLKIAIATQQGVSVDEINISVAAREMRIPETTLRSTLVGRFPASEEYWRKLQVYTTANLDWLICGVGTAPDCEDEKKLNILAVTRSLVFSQILKMDLRDYNVDRVFTPKEALFRIKQRTYHVVLLFDEIRWKESEIEELERLKNRPEVLFFQNGEEVDEGIKKIADRTMPIWVNYRDAVLQGKMG